jgi:hypothetical protein
MHGDPSRQFWCKFCHKSFPVKRYLGRHLRYKHQLSFKQLKNAFTF